MTKRMEAACLLQVLSLIRKQCQLLFPPAMTQCPGVEHTMRRYDVGAAGSARPPPAGDRVMHPQAMHVQKIEFGRLKSCRQPRGIAERWWTICCKAGRASAPTPLLTRPIVSEAEDCDLGSRFGLEGESQSRNRLMYAA